MEKLELALNEVLKTGKGKSILLELDAESYLETNIKTIKKLQKKGLSGVYVSIQRPFKNISSLLKKQGIDLNKLIFIDVASAASKETPEKCKGCVHISPELAVDELVKAIYTSLETMKSKKFIFIDSLTTFALHKPISETLRFSEFLMRQIKDRKDLVLILNVAKDLSHKKFIQDVVLNADKTIKVKI
jgi:KaiC/GvpD/RAD55 family RecA-like ATPase